MTLDLTRPEYREALRWACAGAAYRRNGGPKTRRPHRVKALRTLSSPEQSAALVRAEFSRCGVPADVTYRDQQPHGPHRVHGPTCTAQHVHISVVWPAHGIERDDGCAWATWDYDLVDLPALILALLDATDRDGALAALREAGR